MFSVHQSGNDSVWTFLLESRLSVLSRFLPIARRRRTTGNVELQVYRYSGDGNHRAEPGAEVVPPVQAPRRRHGFLVSFSNSLPNRAFLLATFDFIQGL